MTFAALGLLQLLPGKWISTPGSVYLTTEGIGTSDANYLLSSAIGTPLLLEEPEVRVWINMEKDVLLDPAVIAKAMVAMVENCDNKYPAGTVLEVTDNEEHQWRKVPQYNNPGPQGRAINIGNKDEALKPIKEFLAQDEASNCALAG